MIKEPLLLHHSQTGKCLYLFECTGNQRHGKSHVFDPNRCILQAQTAVRGTSASSRLASAAAQCVTCMSHVSTGHGSAPLPPFPPLVESCPSTPMRALPPWRAATPARCQPIPTATRDVASHVTRRWRSMSTNPISFHECDACRYSYRVERTSWAALFDMYPVVEAATVAMGILVWVHPSSLP